MPNLRELLRRAAPEPSHDWDVTEVARRGRSRRRRRRVAAAGVGGVGVLVALAVAAPVLLDQRDPRVRLGPADEGVSGRSERRVTGHERAIARPLATPGGDLLWPFDRPTLVVVADEALDADAVAALGEEIAGHEAVRGVDVLSADDVRARIGEVQARRVAAGGAVVAALAAEPHEQELRDASGEVLRSVSQEGGAEGRIASAVQPDCRALAQSAALTGRQAATELLAAVECGRPVHVIAANPDAEEPWAATSVGLVQPASLEPADPPASGSGRVTEEGRPADDERVDEERAEADARIEEEPTGEGVATRPSSSAAGSGASSAEPSRAPAPRVEPPPPRRNQPCVAVVTVRVRPAQGCGGDPAAIDGLAGTRWDRDVAVLAGTAPEGTTAVQLDGEEAAVTGEAGEPPMFAGEVAVTGEPVGVRALDADGAVLDERRVTPADLAARPGYVHGPSGPQAPSLEAPWPFDHVAEAAVLVPPGTADADREALRRELAEVDGVVDVTVADDELVRRTLAPPPEHDPDLSLPTVLIVTAEDRDTALGLATLAERHTVPMVHTPTCGVLAGTAMYAGLAHAEALLDDAGCDEPLLIGAHADADEPWVAAAVIEDGTVCLSHERPSSGGSGCGPPPSAGRVQLSRSGGRDHTVVTGQVRGDVDVVELTTDEATRTVQPVALSDDLWVFAVSVRADRELRARAMDADGDVIAEGEMMGPPPDEVPPAPVEERAPAEEPPAPAEDAGG